MKPVRLELTVSRSRVKHSTTEPLRSVEGSRFNITVNLVYLVFGHAGSLSLLFGRFNITVN